MIPPDELIRLWTEHAAALEWLARARCASPEDCVQLAFIRLAKRNVRPNDPLAWLARVVRNAAIDQTRSESRRREREKTFAETFSESFESHVGLDSLFSNEEIADALASMDVEARELITAHIWGELTFRQIADAFEISSSVAHRRYTMAIEELRTKLMTPDKMRTE